MTGQSWLPPHRDHDGDLCIQQAGHIPKTPGEYVRICHYCRRAYIAVVSVALDPTVYKCGGEVLHLRWLTVDREPVT